MLHVLDGDGVPSLLGTNVSPLNRPDAASPRAPSAPSHSRWKALAIAASALVVLGASLTLYRLGHIDRETPPSDEMAVKGSADSFFVGVSRGPHRFIADPLDRLEVGDRLGMFYSAEMSGRLMVVNRDASGEISLLYPAGGKASGPVSAGKEISLSDGALVRDGSGCEWIIAVFSDAPLLFSDVTGAVKQAETDDKTCKIKLEVPGARTVRTLPFQR